MCLGIGERAKTLERKRCVSVSVRRDDSRTRSKFNCSSKLLVAHLILFLSPIVSCKRSTVKCQSWTKTEGKVATVRTLYPTRLAVQVSRLAESPPRSFQRLLKGKELEHE